MDLWFRKFEDIVNFVAEQVAQYHTVLTRANMESWLTRNPNKAKVIVGHRVLYIELVLVGLGGDI